MTKGFIMFVAVFSLIIIAIDFYTYKGLSALGFMRSSAGGRLPAIVYWCFSAVIIIGVFSLLSAWSESYSPFFDALWIIITGAMMVSFFPKLVFSIFHGIDDIVFVIKYAFSKIFQNNTVQIARCFIMTKGGLYAGILVFLIMMYGITIAKYKYRIMNQSVYFNDLPASFDGFRIIQISDIHLGSFMHREKNVKKVFEKINALHPDIIVVTGDWVNNYADEMQGWQEVFKTLSAKSGKYGILGNHDYADYVPWKTQEAKSANLQRLKQYIGESEVRLLLNESVNITKGTDSIVLVGVENWGKVHWSHSYGNLQKALLGTNEKQFRILLSHDPSHWDAQVTGKTNIPLTLSGHTHGMQAGITIGKWEWSPVEHFYKKWGGLYKEELQYLYVNRGFGFIGFPGRVGMRPEITCIELKKRN